MNNTTSTNKFLNPTDPGAHAAAIIYWKKAGGMTRSQVMDWADRMAITGSCTEQEYFHLAYHARQGGFPT